MTESTGSYILQSLIFTPQRPLPEDLCYRGSRFHYVKGEYILEKGGVADFMSYFNAFSWEKWAEYTGLSSLSLSLDIQGSSILTFCSYNDEGTVWGSEEFKIMSSGVFRLDVPKTLLKGHIGFTLKAVSHIKLVSGSWESSSVVSRREIRPVAVCCTYHRDEYLFPTLEKLKNSGWPNLDVIVVDNGSRISREEMNRFGTRFFLYHNPNTGGSGGFSRGLIEALKSEKDYTHVLLMDDDIVLDEETVWRSCQLLQFIKPEYEEYFLAGSMFYMDRPQQMFESTAHWNGYRIKNYNKDLDLSQVENVCRADHGRKRPGQYAAWWFCGIPLNKNMLHHLPFPFFIYGDDMDYSLTWAKGFLTLNGIGVWHEPFTRKFSPLFKSYFFCRNTMILNSLHKELFHPIKTVFNGTVHFFVQLFVHDYRSASLALNAFEDFLEGAEYISAIDEEELLSELNNQACFKIPFEEELTGRYSIKANFCRWKSPLYFLHRKLAVYDHSGEKVELRSRSLREIVFLLARYIRLSFLYPFLQKKASESFRELHRDDDFWTVRLKSLQEYS